MANNIEFHKQVVNNSEFLKPFAVTLTRDSDTAQDLYQETMYRALTNSDKYNVGTNLKAWLYTIMRNIFINDYRRKAKQSIVLNNTPGELVLNNVPSTGVNTAESRLALKDIEAAIQALPDIFRNPFMLYFDGYKYHEIADMLHEPLGTIKSRIHFARKLLKEEIKRS